MAPKRKKKDAKSAAPAAAAAAKKENDDDPLATLLTNIQQLSRNKTRCTEVLQAFLDGKCSVLEGNEEHFDCYWILLTTHIIQRMVQYLEKNKGDENVAVLLATLVHALAMALYADKNKLERSASKTGAVRSALGRGLMSVTIGSTCALQNIAQGDGSTGTEPGLIRRAVWAAMAALDMAINHSTVVKVTASNDGWNHAQHWLLQDAANLDVEHEEGLAAVCEAASQSLNISEEERACIAALVEKEAPPAPSTGKRRRAARSKDDSPSPIATHFQSLMEKELSTHIDGRVSIRRWASMTFVWFCKGQERILEFVNALLTDDEYWNSVLDCPAVIGPKDPPPKKSSSSSKRSSLKRSAEAPKKVTPPVHIFGNVAAVALASRLINALSEAGASCGVRAPSGGMDTYAAHILGLTDTGKGRGRSAAESIPSWTRPDVRNLASVVIYKLIQSHTSCLRSNCTSPEAFGCVLVNDDTEGFGASVPSGITRPLLARFYPAVHKSLNSLCYAAASSTNDLSPRVGDSTKRLLGITSAFILASGEQVRNIVDAKLYGIAVGQLTECLRGIVSDDDRASSPQAMDVDAVEGMEDQFVRLNKEYGLDNPLPIPTLSPASPAKSSRKKKKKANSVQGPSMCTFGGVFPQQKTAITEAVQNMTDEDVLSLLIRAVHASSDEKPPPAAMFTELIEIVHCCYDLKEPVLENIITSISEDDSSKRKGKKRAATAKSSQGKRKKKKVSASASVSSDNGQRKTEQRKLKSLTSSRAGLAADALNALRMLLLHIPTTSSASHSRRELRKYLRETLTTEHVCRVVDLNQMINEALKESHLASKTQKKTSADGAAASFFSATPSGDFRSCEKLLWTAHISLCQVIGRGQPVYDPKQKTGHPILGDARRKLRVFHAVAASSVATNSMAKPTSTAPTEWPLCLPAAQHALVTSNLTCEPISVEAGSDPEHFIAHSFMSSINTALENPSVLTNAQWYKSSFESDGRHAVVIEDDVPLSLRDARLFVLAVSRLPRKQQTEFLNKFVATVSAAISALKSSAVNSALVKEDADVSGFLARVVTVCATLVNVVTVGSKLGDALVSLVGPSHYAMPHFIPSQDQAPLKRMEGGDWYRSETSFVGLFSDWESPVVPSVTGALQLRNVVADDTLSNMRVLHESAIQLGLLSAKHDRCHLLFSAWNASGRRASWEMSPEVVSRRDTSTIDEEHTVRRLLDIRDDICVLHREINGNGGLFPDSILTRFLTDRGDERRPGDLKRKLSSMMSKAETIIDSVLGKITVGEDTKDPSLASFALLEAVSTYVAFIVSAHTRCIDNFLSECGDGPAYSDDDSSGGGNDDDHIETLLRLNEACMTFGAAPTHPDWLDVGCYLRDGITAGDATKIAHRAVVCLEKICAAARAAHVSSISQAIALLIEDGPNCEQRRDLALKLLFSRLGTGTVSGASDDENSDNDGRWIDEIASLCGLQAWQLKVFSSDHACKNCPHVTETFRQNSAQRIVGSMTARKNSFEDWEPNLEEFRACGDWETLLSDALLGSCIDIDLPEEVSELQQNHGFAQICDLAGRWSRVQTTCASHLMPAAALLRFGLSDGLGRKRHPLFSQVTGNDPEEGNADAAAATSLDLSEPLPASSSRSINSRASDDVMRTLGTLVIPVTNDQADTARRPYAAVASNLMIDAKAFVHLEAMEALRAVFENIHRIRVLLDDLGDARGTHTLSASYLLERLIDCVECHGQPCLSADGASPRLGGLLSFLGGQPLSFDTITKDGIDHTEVLSASPSRRDDLNWRQVEDRAVSEIIGALSCSEWAASVHTWSRVSDILSSLARLELAQDPTRLSSRIIKTLNGKSDSFLRTLIQWITCSPPVDPRPDDGLLQNISKDLCTFLCFVIGSAGLTNGRKQTEGLEGGHVLLDGLMQSMDKWLWHEGSVPNNVMPLLCLLGVRYDALHTVGSRILTIMAKGTGAEERDCVEPVELFFRFTSDLEKALSSAIETSSPRNSTVTSRGSLGSRGVDLDPALPSHDGAHTANSVPDACSFILQSGFHQQHWYNCYTCNLVSDKGCCTLCALRCHQGHDVTYSRHSSFFCDCGGEAPTEEESRSACKCLTPIDSAEAEKLFESQQWPVIDAPSDVSECNDIDAPGDHEQDNDLYALAVRMSSSCLEQDSASFFDKLKTEAESSSWTKVLFGALESSHEHWRAKNELGLINEIPEVSMSSEAQETTSDEVPVPSVRGRCGRVLDLQSLGRQTFLPLRAARSGTFQMSLSNDGTTDRVKRAALAKNGVKRRAVVIDCRGRMIVAEPCSLLFCAALPLVNVRYEENSSEGPYARGQISILGSSSTNFNIVGMDLCPANERHLAVWGTAEATVVVLNDACDKVERTIELIFDLESDEVDYLVKCVWVPGSQTMIAVVCGLFVKIFDIQQAEEDKVESLVSYSLAYEAFIRDAALVPSAGTRENSLRTIAETVKLFLLLDIGQLLELELSFDESRQLQEQGDMYIESSEGMSLPVAGVRINHSSQPASEGAAMRSMGEASSVTYLPQSGVLLYACLSSPVLALVLDADGAVSGSFELLPYVVKSEVLGNGSDGYSIHGPFTHFTELGCVEYDKAKYFRVMCVGKSSRTSQPRLLCVDYNEDVVKVKEVSWRSVPVSLSTSFDGLAAFSGPVLSCTADASAALKRTDFTERAYVCALASNGAAVMFGEETAKDGAEVVQRSRRQKSEPSFPVTLFEKLVNVSESEKLVFAGDRVGSATDPDAIKSKLSPNNSSYFMAPSRDGCNITISLLKPNGRAIGPAPAPESGTSHCVASERTAHTVLCEMMEDELIIVALRLLVGSTTTEFIPKYVSVEGRRVWLKPDMKKHYDLPLTAEEIASALRNGFVSLGIGPSFDSGNNPLVDAVEVYAVRREQICHWLPLTCSEMHSSQPHDALASETTTQSETPVRGNRLALSVATLTHLLQVLRTSSNVTPEAYKAIRQVVQATALDDGGGTRQSLSTLLRYIEPDPSQRKRVLDEGMLTGALKVLHSTNEILNKLVRQAGASSSRLEADELRERWNQVRQTTKKCLKVCATVAVERPGNYMTFLESLPAEESQECSVAIVADSIVRKGIQCEFACQDLIPDLVDLCLTESMIFRGRKDVSKASFASFDVIANILRSSDEEIVSVSCESILTYWTQHLSKTTDPVISYQCDGCTLFPITGVRYTLPEGGSSPCQVTDIDLCSDCYNIGRDFASRNLYDARTNVKIRGRTVGKKQTSKLSCARLTQMKRIAIPTTWLVEASAPTAQNVSGSDKLSAGGIDMDTFSSDLFNDLVGLLSDRLKESRLDFSLTAFRSLMDLVLSVVRKSGDDGLILSRSKEFAAKILACTPIFIDVISRNDELEEVARSVLSLCMEGLSRLATMNSDLSAQQSMLNLDECSVEDNALSSSKEKTDSRFICDVHGVPAVRRRCSHGAHKNRRFYVCGMDKTSRCNYFKWADPEDGKLRSSPDSSKCKFTEEIARFLWGLLNKSDGADAQPMSARLCELLERDVHDQVTGALALPDCEVNDTIGVEKVPPSPPSTYDQHTATSDYVDGVFCSKEKLRNSTAQELMDIIYREEGSTAITAETTVFKAALGLLSHVADSAADVSQQQDELEPSGWFPLLCEVISSSESPQYRALAKRALKRLCGGNRAVYHSVRDHYVFAFQFQKLLRDAQSPLLAALNVKEQARQCGMYWRTGVKATFHELPAGGLIGTSDLVSEDCVTVALSTKIGATLDELAKAAESRSGNWRNFCGLMSSPSQGAKKNGSSLNEGSAEAEVDTNLLKAPPIVSLIWMASSLSGENQVKVLQLISVAMSSPKDARPARKRSISPSSNWDSGADVDTVKDCGALLRFCTPSSLPETILLEGDKSLLADEVHAFVAQVVIGGYSVELRKAGGQVALKLCQTFRGGDFEWLFSQLTHRVLSDLSELGSACNELFSLLQSLATSGVSISSSALLSISRKVAEAFTTQLRFIGDSKSTDLFLAVEGSKDSKGSSAERYDFTSCVHCQRTRDSSQPTEATTTSQGQRDAGPSRTSSTSHSAGTQATQDQNVTMLPEQVRPFARESLESSTDVSLSTEFSTYIQLKCRLALSDIHVSIGDPRGRYVKTIAVYFSPRPVSDASILKSEEYADVWQQCAKISLSRGATRATCSISPPVIAANLRIEYLDFYERPGGSRAEDGTLLLHCPRCTRVVSNAHGVCGHCGEVAFQCRKCRHINYLRLDAFLCVECGYCSAATFSYDLTCGAASNAVAVVDDDSYERSIKVLRLSTKLHEELRTTLNERVRSSSGKRSLSVNKYGPALKRTFLGELPRISKEKTEPSVRSLAASSSSGNDDSNPSAAGNRARSLLRLARQLRNESSSDRSRLSDLLVRQSLLGSAGGSGRGVSMEDIDELDSDMVGFISSDIDGPDPLSRIVASIQGRSARSSNARDGSSGGGSGNARSHPGENNSTPSTTGGTPEASAKASSDECDRLYQLMREAEGECHELRRRINAWTRLENDALADLGTAQAVSSSFSPSQCSTCSGPLGLQLLTLFMALFESNTEVVQAAVTKNFIRALFDESSTMDKDLFDAKRAAIASLATKSEKASSIILDELRIRLQGSRDRAASAEILGKIMAIDSPLGDDFMKLGGEVLSSGY